MNLEDFLTDSQKKSVSTYTIIQPEKLLEKQMYKGDYIKFMYTYNYQFMEGGIIIGLDNYPVVRLKSYATPPTFYTIDLSKVFVWYKRNLLRQTKRQFFEELLTSLKNNPNIN